jgi:hypothetical protein
VYRDVVDIEAGGCFGSCVFAVDNLAFVVKSLEQAFGETPSLLGVAWAWKHFWLDIVGQEVT